MKLRNIIAIVLLLLSLACLIPGLTLPILSLEIGAALPLVGKMTLHESTQSIWDTIRTLHKNDNTFTAFLILFFSILIPIFKALVLLLILLVKKIQQRAAWHNFVALISKWSMADVFVVGVFIAFLATSSNDAIDAKLGNGFYWFLAYCIISIAASQIMKTKQLPV